MDSYLDGILGTGPVDETRRAFFRRALYEGLVIDTFCNVAHCKLRKAAEALGKGHVQNFHGSRPTIRAKSIYELVWTQKMYRLRLLHPANDNIVPKLIKHCDGITTYLNRN